VGDSPPFYILGCLNNDWGIRNKRRLRFCRQRLVICSFSPRALIMSGDLRNPRTRLHLEAVSTCSTLTISPWATSQYQVIDVFSLPRLIAWFEDGHRYIHSVIYNRRQAPHYNGITYLQYNKLNRGAPCTSNKSWPYAKPTSKS
jgi:hypothetical protein